MMPARDARGAALALPVALAERAAGTSRVDEPEADAE